MPSVGPKLQPHYLKKSKIYSPNESTLRLVVIHGTYISSDLSLHNVSFACLQMRVTRHQTAQTNGYTIWMTHTGLFRTIITKPCLKWYIQMQQVILQSLGKTLLDWKENNYNYMCNLHFTQSFWYTFWMTNTGLFRTIITKPC